MEVIPDLAQMTSAIVREWASFWASQVAPVIKNPPASAGDVRHEGSIPGLGRSPIEGKGYPLQYSGLENSTDWIVHGVAKSWAWPSDFHFAWNVPLVSLIFLKISSLSSFIVFLYFFALITEESFFISLSLLFIETPFLCLLLIFFSQLFLRPPQRQVFSRYFIT